MYKHIFGPVPSRRLGMSLGVDLVPHKVCTFDCIYCECGPTTNQTLKRKEYIPVDGLIKELQAYFNQNPIPDYITFSGAGEPTLHLKIGEIIQFIKSNYPAIPVAVLTNGSLLFCKKIRKELLNADVILPSLDAAIDEDFQKINRPHPKLFLEDYIRGLIDFRKEFRGEIWLEVMVIPGYNDSIENLKSIKEAIVKIKPDKIQLNTLDRPGVIENIRAATRHELQTILEFWQLEHAEIIAEVPERKEIKSYRREIESTILETVARRPCTLDDLVKILGLHPNEINKYLGILEDEKKLISVRQERGLFYQLKH